MNRPIAAAILAGGRAARCRGLPKGMLRLPDGRSIIERTIAAIRAAGPDDIVLIANDPDPYRGLGRDIIPDHRPGLGPLAGIETALLHYRGRAEGLLILPCDLPAITPREIAGLLTAFLRSTAVADAPGVPGLQSRDRPPAVVAQTPDAFWQPLCAVLRVDILPDVAQALDDHRLGVYRLWRDLGARPVRFPDPAAFFNVNSLEDLERWLLDQAQAPPASPRSASDWLARPIPGP